MTEFSITFEEVEKIAADLRARANKMQAILDDVTSKINAVHNDSWQSSAAETHLNEYNVLKSKYASFYEKVIDCAEFLEQAAKAGRETDSGIQSALS